MTSVPYKSETYDVAVVGGGSAGVAAAVSAARLGAQVVLIEKYGFLGGAATNSIVMTYDGFFYKRDSPEWAVGGIGKEFLLSMMSYGNSVKPYLSKHKNWILPFEPELAKHALDEIVVKAGIVCRLHALVVDTKVVGSQIRSLTLKDHRGEFEVQASQFIDSSGEANLASLAGVPMSFEAEPRYAASLCARISGLPENLTLDRHFLQTVAQAAAAHSETHCLRRDGGFVMRIPNSQDIWWMGTDLATDGLSSISLTEVEQESRAAAWAFVRALRKMPGCERVMLIASGPQIGIRETRHPIARYMLSESDALAGRRSTTAIARAAWNIERHDVPGYPSMTPLGGDDFFDIPMDALRAIDITNLWLAGRTIGSDRGAFGSLRVMGTAFATGQAAGVCAALSTHGNGTYDAIRDALLTSSAII